MIIIGEDYGEGASVIQERSYAYAMKSSMWLIDPRPDLPTIVRCVEEGLRALRGEPCAGDAGAAHPRLPRHRRRSPPRTTAPAPIRRSNRSPGPPRFDYARLAHPPVTFVHERLKVESRMPAAQALHPRAQAQRGDPRRPRRDRHHRAWAASPTALLRALERLGLADAFGASRVPILVLNVVYPLVPEELRAFCAGKRAVLVVEEGHPDYIEQAVNVELRRADINTRDLGKGALPKAGEYTAEVLLDGLAAFLARDAAGRHRCRRHRRARCDGIVGRRARRPPRRSANCRRGRRPSAPAVPERPVFSAIKLVQRELGPIHISADIGCHSFATMPPFSIGNSILGYGMSLAERRRGRPQHGEAPDRGDGRRRLLAQRPASPASPATCSTRATACWSSCRTATPRRPASNSCRRAPAGRNGAPTAWTSRRRCAPWA